MNKIRLALSFVILLSTQSFAGTIETPSHDVLGYITRSGKVESPLHDVLGYITRSGKVEARSTTPSATSRMCP